MKMTSFPPFSSLLLPVCMSQRKICLAETCAWIIRTATQLAAHCLALSTLATHSHTETERERESASETARYFQFTWCHAKDLSTDEGNCYASLVARDELGLINCSQS